MAAGGAADVLLDLGEDAAALLAAGAAYEITGLDTTTPKLVLKATGANVNVNEQGTHTFVGVWDPPVGTLLFVEPHRAGSLNATPGEGLSDAARIVGATSKRVVFRRVPA